MQSESVLVALLALSPSQWLLLCLIASIGNVLGSILNWYLGRYLQRFVGKSWFPANEQQLQRASAHYQHYGYWSLLLSWLPIIGDPITLIAGVMKEPLWRFSLLVSIAKTGRYLTLVAITLSFISWW